MFFKKVIFTIKDIFIKKTIQDLDINLINENHLIVLQEGYVMFRRTGENPLEFQYNDTIVDVVHKIVDVVHNLL